MLTITIPEKELFDETSEKFIKVKEQKIVLEHSLLSLSKWESKNHIRFIDNSELTNEQILDYIHCMVVTPVNLDKEVLYGLTPDNVKEIRAYISEPRTATILPKEEGGKGNSREKSTSELIYYWMIASGIPFECEKWHLDRLLTLIRICQIKNQPDKKISRQDALNRTRNLNKARRAARGKH